MQSRSTDPCLDSRRWVTGRFPADALDFLTGFAPQVSAGGRIRAARCFPDLGRVLGVICLVL